MDEELVQRETVLVVDDLEDNRYPLRIWLEQRGYDVAEAMNGEEAVESAARIHPALILMDLFMPKLDGFAAFSKLRENAELSETPVIAISAYGDLGIKDQLRSRVLGSGFAAYLTKPYDFLLLEELLSQLLSKK